MKLGQLFTKSLTVFLFLFLISNQSKANESLLSPPPPPPCEERDTINITICSFSSYTFYSTTYSMPGTYHDTTSGACDTIHTLILDTTAGTYPTITITPSGNTVCWNDSVVISSSFTFGGASQTYIWKKNGGTVGTNSPTLSVLYDSLNNGDSFQCVLISTDPCTMNNPVNSNVMILAKSSLVKPTMSISGNTIDVGVVTDGYQWYKDNILMTNDTNQTLWVSLYDTACYVCEVSDNLGCAVKSWNLCIFPLICLSRDTVVDSVCSFSSYSFYSNTYSLPGTYHDTVIGGTCDVIHTLILDTISGKDPSISISPSGNVVCWNDSIVISSTIMYGGLTQTYNWKKNGLAFGGNTSNLTVHYDSLSNGDMFTCQMVSTDPCSINNPVNSNSVTLPKSSLTKPVMSISNDTMNVGVVAAGYQWYKDNVLLTNDTNSILIVSLLDTACYVCEVSDVLGCSVKSWNLCVFPMTCLVRDTIVDSMCTFSTYSFYGNTYTSAGTYHDTVTGGSCDTIHTLLLDTTSGTTPSISLSSSGSVVCFDDSVIISSIITYGGSSPTYQWKKGGLAFGGNTPNLTVHYDSLSNGDSFQCVLVSNDGCTIVNPVNSNTIVLSKSSLTVRPVMTISNDTMDVGVVAAGYQWYRDNVFLPNDTNSTLIVSMFDTACYVCEISDSLGCSIDSWNLCVFPMTCSVIDTITETICSFSNYTFYGNTYNLPGTYSHVINGVCDTVHRLILDTTAGTDPTVSISPSNPTVCLADSVMISTTIMHGGSSPTYQWKKNGLAFGGNTSNLTVHYDSLNNGDSFSVTMVSNDPCTINNPVNSNIITLVKSITCDSCINVYDTITTSVCTGDSILFAGTYYNTAGLYSDTNGLVSGCDSITTLNLSFSSGIIPTINVSTSLSMPICVGTAISFSTSITDGGITPTYQWQRNGNNVGTGLSTYSPSGGLNNNGDVIICVLTSSLGCASPVSTIDSVVLQITTGITVNISDSICSGDSLLFSGSYYNTPGIYSDTVSLASGCDSVTTLNLSISSSVVPTVTISTSVTMPVCNGTIISFSTSNANGGGAPSYQWKRNGTNVGTGLSTYSPSGASNINGDTITCTLTSSLGCASQTTASDILIIQLVNGFTVNIADSICAGDSLLFGGTYLKTAGNYADTVTLGAGCDSITNLTLSIANGFVVNISDSICTGDSLIFSGTYYKVAGNYADTVNLASGCDSITNLSLTYKNSCNPCVNVFTTIADSICTGDSIFFGSIYYNTPGTYKDTITIAGGCDSLVTLSLSNTTSVTPSISISANVTTICPNQTVTFSSSIVNGGTSPFYQWKINGVNMAANGSVYTSNGGQIVNGDVVTCYLVSSSSCANPDTVYSNSVTILVGGATTTPITDTICQNEYYIFNGDSLNTSGTYYDTISNSGGCDSIVQLNLQVFPSPIVVANSDIDTISVGGTVNFYPNGSNASNYLWDFGDSFSSTLNTVSHTYNTFGTFTVILKGELLYGCTTYDTLTILVLNNVGISENDMFSSKIRVYPNPVRDEFSLAFEFGVNTNVQIQLFSTNGKLLQDEKMTVANEVVLFNGINYEKGVYFLHIKSNNNTAVRRLIIIE